VQSDILTDEYIKKLNEIIDYFKIEKEGQMYFQNYSIEEKRSTDNFALTIIVIFIGISNAFLIAGSEFKILAIILIVLTLLLMAFHLLTIVKSSKKRISAIVEGANRYNIVLYNLQSLKILDYEVDLSKLIEKIKYRYRIYRFIDDDTWFNEIHDCLTEINKQIYEKERKPFGEHKE
jgi:hypothetical protein